MNPRQVGPPPRPCRCPALHVTPACAEPSANELKERLAQLERIILERDGRDGEARIPGDLRSEASTVVAPLNHRNLGALPALPTPQPRRSACGGNEAAAKQFAHAGSTIYEASSHSSVVQSSDSTALGSAAGSRPRVNPYQDVWAQLRPGHRARPPEIAISNSDSGSAPPRAQSSLQEPLQAKEIERFLAFTEDTDRLSAAVARARHDIAELESQLAEERGARKAAEARAMELRMRIADAEARAAGEEPPAAGDSARIARFQSLVRKNPIMVDSFWVPVDRGVQARLDIAEYATLAKLKFSSKVFDKEGVKEWNLQNGQRVAVGKLIDTVDGLATAAQSAVKGASSVQSLVTQENEPLVVRGAGSPGRRAGGPDTFQFPGAPPATGVRPRGGARAGADDLFGVDGGAAGRGRRHALQPGSVLGASKREGFP